MLMTIVSIINMDKCFIVISICTIFLRGFECKFPTKHEDDQMMVAFKCGHQNVYLMDGVWKRDKSFVCPKNNKEILNYCRHVYPDDSIDNIMESEGDKVVASWCQTGDPSCLGTFDGVVPFKCLGGKFQNEALLVPATCIFDHLHDSTQCSSARAWSEMAGKSCKGRGLVIHKSSMLKPCGLNKFTGVEFVCCPESFEGDLTLVVSAQVENKTKPFHKEKDGRKEPEEGRMSSRSKIVEAYLNRDEWRNVKPMTEHDFYLKAKKDLAKSHKQKVNEMINDWNSASSRAKQLEEVNKSEGEKFKKQLSERFHKLYEAEEIENEMEKIQLSDLHQQRVTAELNDRKQKALNHYLTTIDQAKPEAADISKALKHLIKILHKDKLHTVNRYKHLMDIDPERADHTRESSANHISELDRQLDEAVSLLDRVPKLSEEIHHLIAGQLDSYRSVDVSVFVVMEEDMKEITKDKDTKSLVKPLEDDYVLDVSDAGRRIYDDDYFKVVDGDDDTEKRAGDESFPRNDGRTLENGFFKINPDDVRKFKQGNEDDDDDDEGMMMIDEKMEEGGVKSKKTGHKQITDMPSRDKEQIVDLVGTVNKQKIEINQAEDIVNINHNNINNNNDDEDRSEDLKEMDVVSSLDGDIYDRHFFHSPDHIHKSELIIEQGPKYMKHSPSSIPGPNFGAAIPLGVAVGTLTVAVVIAIGVLVMRRRGTGGLYHNPSVDPPVESPQNGSPEERHVANMQINGYENPTYKYFERYQQGPPVEA